jgi:hypothetical protein
LEVLIPGSNVLYRVEGWDANSVTVTDHIDRYKINILKLLQNKERIFIKRIKWEEGDERCLAEGVQRNALDRGILELDMKISLNDNDLILIVDTDEFIDPVFILSLKNNTWISNTTGEFTISDGRQFKITHSSWDQSVPVSPPIRIIGPPKYNLPFPLCAEHIESYYGIKLCLHWHIFNPTLRKSIEWGRRQESAILTTWGAYKESTPHGGTFGKRMPCNFRRNIPTFPQIGPSGWHLSWLNPIGKLGAYAEWSKERGMLAKNWMLNCIKNKLDPTPIIFSEHFDTNDDTKTFDRNDRILHEVEDVYMPDILKKLS